MAKKDDQFDEPEKVFVHTKPISVWRDPEGILMPGKPTSVWKQLVAHLCIGFLVMSLVMLYFSSTGSPQAGLLEIGISSLLFVVLFLLVLKFFPYVAKIITTILIIGVGISFIFINYHFLKTEKKDASFQQLLVGDLFVHKIMKTVQEEQIMVATDEEGREPVSTLKEKISSPDQLKMFLSNPLPSEMESPRVTSLAPLEKEEVSFPVKKNTMQTVAINLYDSSLPPSKFSFDFIHDELVASLEFREVVSPLFENMLSVCEPYLAKPSDDGLIPIK
ncbi:MAG: hypothetical protein MRJ65_05585 [Candidatus Brocadiaceae bacterium]|nr:hypothetical protein [Candidatus Brocadiaceae bacterium]